MKLILPTLAIAGTVLGKQRLRRPNCTYDQYTYNNCPTDGSGCEPADFRAAAEANNCIDANNVYLLKCLNKFDLVPKCAGEEGSNEAEASEPAPVARKVKAPRVKKPKGPRKPKGPKKPKKPVVAPAAAPASATSALEAEISVLVTPNKEASPVPAPTKGKKPKGKRPPKSGAKKKKGRRPPAAAPAKAPAMVKEPVRETKPMHVERPKTEGGMNPQTKPMFANKSEDEIALMKEKWASMSDEEKLQKREDMKKEHWGNKPMRPEEGHKKPESKPWFANKSEDEIAQMKEKWAGMSDEEKLQKREDMKEQWGSKGDYSSPGGHRPREMSDEVKAAMKQVVDDLSAEQPEVAEKMRNFMKMKAEGKVDHNQMMLFKKWKHGWMCEDANSKWRDAFRDALAIDVPAEKIEYMFNCDRDFGSRPEGGRPEGGRPGMGERPEGGRPDGGRPGGKPAGSHGGRPGGRPEGSHGGRPGGRPEGMEGGRPGGRPEGSHQRPGGPSAGAGRGISGDGKPMTRPLEGERPKRPSGDSRPVANRQPSEAQKAATFELLAKIEESDPMLAGSIMKCMAVREATMETGGTMPDDIREKCKALRKDSAFADEFKAIHMMGMEGGPPNAPSKQAAAVSAPPQRKKKGSKGKKGVKGSKGKKAKGAKGAKGAIGARSFTVGPYGPSQEVKDTVSELQDTYGFFTKRVDELSDWLSDPDSSHSLANLNRFFEGGLGIEHWNTWKWLKEEHN